MMQASSKSAAPTYIPFPSRKYKISSSFLPPNLKPELQEKIKPAFFSFDWEGSAFKEEFSKSSEEDGTSIWDTQDENDDKHPR